MNRTMNKPRTSIAALLALLLAITTVVANFSAAYAASLTSASLSLQNPNPTATSQYTLTANGFTTAQTIGCIEVDLGTAADGSGTISGLGTGSATFVSQSITASGTWTSDTSQGGVGVNKLRLVNSTPVVPQAGSQTAVFGAITNGNTANTSYFAVVKTYTTNSCATPVDTTTVQFVYTDGQSVTATIDPTLIFAVAGVTGNGVLTVNGNTITNGLATTTNTIPFGTLSTGSNKIAAQDVSVTTNASSGYTVYIRYSGPLSAGTGKDLADLSGAPNSTPITFPASTEAFGYTTEDAVLGTGTTGRFSGNKWAAFTTSPQEVAFKATGGAIDTNRIGFQTGITGTTKPGAYATTVIYTATPIY